MILAQWFLQIFCWKGSIGLQCRNRKIHLIEETFYFLNKRDLSHTTLSALSDQLLTMIPSLIMETLWQSWFITPSSAPLIYLQSFFVLFPVFNDSNNMVQLVRWQLLVFTTTQPFLFLSFWQTVHYTTHCTTKLKQFKRSTVTRATEILKSKSVRSTDDVIGTCVRQSQIVTKTNDSSFSSRSVSEIDYLSNTL